VKHVASSAIGAAPWMCAGACASFWFANAAIPATDVAPDADSASAPEEPADYWTGPIQGPVPKTLAGATVIHTGQLKGLLTESGVVLVEVSNAPRRPEHLAAGAPWLPTPHAVIPGSTWIPGAGMGEIAPDVEGVYRDLLARATDNDLDRPIVIYCHERCWLSWNAAKRAVRLGYRRVHWYPEGIEGWRAAGLETSVADDATKPATAGSPSS
jgi:PQQ-dependent catabolism-associated CXXCW motif protein